LGNISLFFRIPDGPSAMNNNTSFIPLSFKSFIINSQLFDYSLKLIHDSNISFFPFGSIHNAILNKSLPVIFAEEKPLTLYTKFTVSVEL